MAVVADKIWIGKGDLHQFPVNVNWGAVFINFAAI